MTDAAATCPSCAAPVLPDDTFCEACGTRLVPEPPPAPAAGSCPGCGADPSEIADDGYCGVCGRKQADERDHLTSALATAAGITDRGLRHHRNEDAMAFADAPNGAPGDVLVVVCDGVSSSSDPQLASQAAADAALAALSVAAEAGWPAGTDGALRTAIGAAQAAAAAVPFSAGEPAPSCTIVAATLLGDRITTAWLGDSRAYWLGADPSTSLRLTVDDSWAAEQVAAGLMDEAEAQADPEGHAITRWLGADAVDLDPHLGSLQLEAPGRLLVCSDGLWNHLSDAAALAERSNALALPEAAAALCNLALDGGGHDNITVVLADGAPTPQPRSTDA